MLLMSLVVKRLSLSPSRLFYAPLPPPPRVPPLPLGPYIVWPGILIFSTTGLVSITSRSRSIVVDSFISGKRAWIRRTSGQTSVHEEHFTTANGRAGTERSPTIFTSPPLTSNHSNCWRESWRTVWCVLERRRGGTKSSR